MACASRKLHSLPFIDRAIARVIRFTRDVSVVSQDASRSSHFKYDRKGISHVITGNRYGFKHKLTRVRPSTCVSGVLVHHT